MFNNYVDGKINISSIGQYFFILSNNGLTNKKTIIEVSRSSQSSETITRIKKITERVGTLCSNLKILSLS